MFGLAAISSAIGLAAMGLMSFFTGDDEYALRLNQILLDTPIIDGHNDFPYQLRLNLGNKLRDPRFTFERGLLSHTDLRKLRKGRLGGQFWSVYAECNQPNETGLGVRDTLEQIDVMKRVIQTFNTTFKYVTDSNGAMEAYKAGFIASMLGAEGLHQTGNSLAVIRQFYELGVRYITLNHNCDNAFSTAASTVAAGWPDLGLTEYGRHAIYEMNRLGMLVDLAHVSHKTMEDVIDVTKAPVMFSHSSAYAKCPVLRNVPDHVLRRVAENNGVVMIAFVSMFIRNDGGRATIDQVADHIFHVAEVAGWSHVGLGSDYDGMCIGPLGLEDVSGYASLLKLVMKRGATDDQVRGLMGANILRVWRATEEISRMMATDVADETTEPGRVFDDYDLHLDVSYSLPKMF